METNLVGIETKICLTYLSLTFKTRTSDPKKARESFFYRGVSGRLEKWLR